MTDWVTITNEQVDPESPVTSELMTALRDNVSALAEQSSGAPEINSWAAHTYQGAGSGVSQNTTGRPIMVFLVAILGSGARVAVSPDNVTYTDLLLEDEPEGNAPVTVSFIVPDTWYYDLDDGGLGGSTARRLILA